jgi:hypothetical protein
VRWDGTVVDSRGQICNFGSCAREDRMDWCVPVPPSEVSAVRRGDFYLPNTDLFALHRCCFPDRLSVGRTSTELSHKYRNLRPALAEGTISVWSGHGPSPQLLIPAFEDLACPSPANQSPNRCRIVIGGGALVRDTNVPRIDFTSILRCLV